MFCGTWNVAGRRIAEDVSPFLLRGLGGGCTTTPDIYCVALQEVVGLSDRKRQCGYVMQASRTDRQCSSIYSLTKDNVTKSWRRRIHKALTKLVMFRRSDAAAGASGDWTESSESEYRCLVCKQMVGVLLCIFIRQRWFSRVSNLKSRDIAFGFMGRAKNKGCVCASFNLLGAKFTFASAHLASGQSASKRRDDDMRALRAGVGLEGAEAKPDFLFLLGDLNYRIDAGGYDATLALVERRDYESLRRGDQLLARMGVAGGPFEGFREASITFPPTYKFAPFSNAYDPGSGGKLRAPAWCDRVLYRAQDKDRVRQLFYASASMLSSDHKPVVSLHEVLLDNPLQIRKGDIPAEDEKA